MVCENCSSFICSEDTEECQDVQEKSEAHLDNGTGGTDVIPSTEVGSRSEEALTRSDIFSTVQDVMRQPQPASGQ